MKHYVLWGLIVAAFFLLSSCGSSKKIQEKSPVTTFIMPGADLVRQVRQRSLCPEKSPNGRFSRISRYFG